MNSVQMAERATSKHLNFLNGQNATVESTSAWMDAVLATTKCIIVPLRIAVLK